MTAAEHDTKPVSPSTKQQQFETWRDSFPSKFPEELQHNNLYHNPFIKNHKIYTHQAVYQGLKLAEHIAALDGFYLNDDTRWAYVHYLQCLSGAMAFEDKHRNDGDYKDF